MEIQLELNLDHEDSLNYWACLLADQESDDRDSGTWDHYYEYYWDKLESGEDLDLLTPWGAIE